MTDNVIPLGPRPKKKNCVVCSHTVATAFDRIPLCIKCRDRGLRTVDDEMVVDAQVVRKLHGQADGLLEDMNRGEADLDDVFSRLESIVTVLAAMVVGVDPKEVE